MRGYFFIFLFFFGILNSAYSTDNVETISKERSKHLSIKENFKEIFNSNIYDLYIPANTWHNRIMYDYEKTRRYHERPWGIGFGKTRIDKKKNLHQLYGMEFQDSHNKMELIFGYSYQYNFFIGSQENFRIGLGITAGITMREDYYYVPLPLPLPMLSFGYKAFSVESVYIPGLYNTGNVLFTWVRVSFKI